MASFIKSFSMLFLSVLVLAFAAVFYQLQNYPSLKPYESYFIKPSSEKINENSVTAMFLGTTSILISDGETSIMTDGFFTRPSLTTLLLGNIMPDRELIADVLNKAKVTNLLAVIPLHSHHDHAMDAPEVALQTGALLLGSESTANIGRGWGLAENQIKVVKPGEHLQFGKFTVTLIPSRHTPVIPFIAKLTGIGETITKPLHFPASLSAFKEGGSYAVFIKHPQGNILIQGSTGYVEGALQGYQADVVFLGIARLGNSSSQYKESYYRETVTNLQATRIIAIHWDDFMLPLKEPLRPQIRVVDDFDAAMSFLIRKTKDDSRVSLHMLPHLRRIELFPPP